MQPWYANGMLKHLAAAAFSALVATHTAPVLAADSAVIVMYHRFGESAHPSTNTTLDQFEAHIEELKRGRYTVLPVPDILAAMREKRNLPDRTVGITIDDGYLSVYTQAWPRLRAAGFPFTVFVATDGIDAGFNGLMNWEQVRELHDAGVVIGEHTASHLHMAASDMARNIEDMKHAGQRFVAELGRRPGLFAYPYGETSTAIQAMVRDQGFEFAFGQHSGVLHRTSDPLYLPRFALNEAFGEIDRFRLLANALPVPHGELTPGNPLLTLNPPPFGFTLPTADYPLPGLACYAAGQGRVQVERAGRRVEVRLSEKFNPGRARINCTARGPEGRWRWLGFLYYVP